MLHTCTGLFQESIWGFSKRFHCGSPIRDRIVESDPGIWHADPQLRGLDVELSNLILKCWCMKHICEVPASLDAIPICELMFWNCNFEIVFWRSQIFCRIIGRFRIQSTILFSLSRIGGRQLCLQVGAHMCTRRATHYTNMVRGRRHKGPNKKVTWPEGRQGKRT